MERKAVLIVLFLGAAFGNNLVWAQTPRGMSFPKIFGNWNAVVGAGAAYRVETVGDEKPSRFEVALVGQEKVDDKPAYWIEMSLTSDGPDGRAMILKALASKVPDDVTINRVIVKAPDQAPIEMPRQMLQRGGAVQKQTFAWKRSAKLLGTEVINTPAGKFLCEHYQTTDGEETYDLWLSDEVRPYGLVKSQNSRITLLLQKILAEQKTKVSEPAKPFALPGVARQ